MLLHKKEIAKKEARARQKEINDLYRQIAEIAPIKLDKPIFAGYKKYFVLREDVKHRDDYKKVLEVLEKVNRTVYCKTKDFINRVGKRVTPVEHYPRSIYPPRWDLSEPRRSEELEWIRVHRKNLWGTYTRGAYCIAARCSHGNSYTPHYHFYPEWMLDTKIEEWYYTHYRPIDGEMESRQKWLQNQQTYNYDFSYGCGCDYCRSGPPDPTKEDHIQQQLIELD